MSAVLNPPAFVYGPNVAANGVNVASSGQALSGVGLSGYAAPVNGLGYYGGYTGFAPIGGYSNYGYSYGGQVGGASSAVGLVPGTFQLDEETIGEIESRVLFLNKPRQAFVRRQVIKVPRPAGRVQQVVRRLPTPTPDVIERIYVVKPQRDVVNVLIERPTTPPPQVQERQVLSKQHRPIINQQVITVPPRSYNIAAYSVPTPQPVAVSYGGYRPAAAVAPNIGSAENLAAFGGYNFQYQPPAAAAYTGAVAYQPAFTGAAYQPATSSGVYQPATAFTGAAAYQPTTAFSGAAYQPATAFSGAAYQPATSSGVYQPAAAFTGAAAYPAYQATPAYGYNQYYQYYPYPYQYSPYGYNPSVVAGYNYQVPGAF